MPGKVGLCRSCQALPRVALSDLSVCTCETASDAGWALHSSSKHIRLPCGTGTMGKTDSDEVPA